MPPLQLSKDKIQRLCAKHSVDSFDCGDSDLNEFLVQDAKRYSSELLAVTYLVLDKENLAAFFSVQNDKLMRDFGAFKAAWNRINRQIPNEKRKAGYPSVKLGRLGVANEYQRTRLGTQILDWLKILFITENRTGCRFITIDAYNKPNVLKFYQRNGFSFLTDEDEAQKTRLLYFDLKPVADVAARAHQDNPTAPIRSN